MTILNDRAIRQLCLVPTHQTYNHYNSDRQLYARVDGALYSVNSGHRYNFEEYNEKLGLQELTQEQARGYASGGAMVPTSALQLKDLEIDGWDATEMEMLKEMEQSPSRTGTRQHYQQIRERLEKLVAQHAPIWGRMITPFEPSQIRTREVCVNVQAGEQHPDGSRSLTVETAEQKIISYGTSSMGYDVRLAEEFRIFSNVNSAIIDPKKFDERCLLLGELREDDGGKYVILPPNSYLLGHTIEYMRIPRDIMVIAIGKSTYARAGAIVNVTPIEPGFEGTVVIEVSNSTPLPLKVYANEGIAQFVFFRGEACETSYGDRGGKYQGQQGIVLPKT
jgi:dCTP deaminase